MSGNASAWKADGSGWRARIGLLTHDDNTVSESEFWTMAPAGVSIHSARVLFNDLRTFADPPGVDRAAGQLARLPLQAIVFAFTTGSYLLGKSGEQALVARLEQHSNGIPVVMPAAAAVAAFHAVQAGRIALVHAPFFTDEVDGKAVGYFEEHGFDVVQASHVMPAETVPHPNLGTISSPADIYEWVRSHTPNDAQAVFIAGNGYRSIGVISALEEDLGIPVLNANQVALWYVLRKAGVLVGVDGYGQLFKRPL